MYNSLAVITKSGKACVILAVPVHRLPTPLADGIYKDS